MIQQRESSLHATTIERSNGLGADIGLFGHRQGLLMLWLMGLAVVCARLLAFPLLPVDETRYLSVAWEMHQSSNWLVPHINGEPYPQKPPLMFWLLNIGWLLGIGSDFLSRLVVPMAGLMNVLALRALIVSVAPRQQQLAALSPWLLLGAFSWQVFMALTMFDMLVCLFLLLALTSLFKAQQNRYWAVVSGIAVGLGMLTKGPVFLLYWLPIGLSAFYWRPEHLALKRWYQGLAMATVVGIAVILAWAIPAAMAGGSDYAQAIFWRQSAGRVANAFAHTRPWYWYLTLLPLFLLPWVAMPFGRAASLPRHGSALCCAAFCRNWCCLASSAPSSCIISFPPSPLRRSGWPENGWSCLGAAGALWRCWWPLRRLSAFCLSCWLIPSQAAPCRARCAGWRCCRCCWRPGYTGGPLQCWWPSR